MKKNSLQFFSIFCLILCMSVQPICASVPVSSGKLIDESTNVLSSETGTESETQVPSSETETESETQVPSSETGTEPETQVPSSETGTEPEIPAPVVKPLAGLQNINGKIYYYQNGSPFTNGYKKVTENSNNYYYFFSESGAAYTKGYKKVKIGSKHYYFYFTKNGRAYTKGLKSVKVNGKKCYFYFNKDGRAFTKGYKRIKVGSKKYVYYFSKNGKAYTKGYKKITRKGKTYYYYFTSNGRAYTKGIKRVSINGQNKIFYFRGNGQALTNSFQECTINGSTGYYYFDASGAAVTNCFKTINNQEYYFDSTGKALTGKHTIDHYLCYFDQNGVLYRKLDINAPMVALTYDDGPSVNTTTILNTLKQNNSVATFFVVGYQIPTYASTVQTAYSMGCEIGNHTFEHKILTKVSLPEVSSQISSTNAQIASVIGTAPIVMRPPGGNYNDAVRGTINMPIIMWSIDTRDWETRDASKTITAVLNQVSDGDIVLMHDLYASTADASKTIIPTLVARGYQLVTVSELAECRGGLVKGGVYRSFKR